MPKLAVLVALIGLILMFTVGKLGYVFGPLLIVIGAIVYRQERLRRDAAAAGPRIIDAVPNNVPRATASARRSRFWPAAACVAVIAAAAAAGGLSLTHGLADTAEGFFLAVQVNDMEKARGYLSEEFSAATSPPALDKFLDEASLKQYKSASWSKRAIVNSRGELEGVITTATGSSVPVRIYLVKEHGSWKIYSIQKPAPGLLKGTEPEDPSMKAM